MFVQTDKISPVFYRTLFLLGPLPEKEEKKMKKKKRTRQKEIMKKKMSLRKLKGIKPNV